MCNVLQVRSYLYLMLFKVNLCWLWIQFPFQWPGHCHQVPENSWNKCWRVFKLPWVDWTLSHHLKKITTAVSQVFLMCTEESYCATIFKNPFCSCLCVCVSVRLKPVLLGIRTLVSLKFGTMILNQNKKKNLIWKILIREKSWFA